MEPSALEGRVARRVGSVGEATGRGPESLKDRLATIIQRGHVERRSSDEIAEMVLRELGTVWLSSEQIAALPAIDAR